MSADRVLLEEVTPAVAAVFADNNCLIWSGEHSAWWRANKAGYTTDRRMAGRYTIGSAYAAAGHCGPEKGIAFVQLAAEDWRRVPAQSEVIESILARRYEGAFARDKEVAAEIAAALGPAGAERRLRLVKSQCEVRDDRWRIKIDAGEEPCAVRVIHREHGDYMEWPDALEEQGVCVAADRAYVMQEESSFHARSAAMKAAHDFLRRFGAGEVEYLEWDVDSQSMVVVGHGRRRDMQGWWKDEADKPDPLAPFYPDPATLA